MTGLERALLRFLGLWAVVAGVELLERVAYRAGVEQEAARHGVDPDEPLRVMVVTLDDEDAVFDASDVVDAHAGCCPVTA